MEKKREALKRKALKAPATGECILCDPSIRVPQDPGTLSPFMIIEGRTKRKVCGCHAHTACRRESRKWMENNDDVPDIDPDMCPKCYDFCWFKTWNDNLRETE